MENIYLIKGLDCSNCARKLEEKISKIEGIESCSLNFFTSKLIVKSDKDVHENIVKTATSFEDNISIRKIK